jgi:hypothetical protein
MFSFKNTPLAIKTVFTFFLITGCFKIIAQDTLYLNNSTKEIIVLLEINPDNIKYKRFDNQSGPTYTKLKSELKHVVYKNGVKEQFAADTKSETKTETKQETAKAEKDPMEDFFNGDKPDTLFFLSGKKTLGKVLIVNNSEVKYKLWDYQDGPTYQASKNELSSIHSGRGKIMDMKGTENQVSIDNGARPVTESPTNNTGNNGVNNSENGNYSTSQQNPYSYNPQLYNKGMTDARKNYTDNGGTFWVGCVSVGCTPVCGLIPAIMIGDNQPKEANLGIPRSAYSEHPDYRKGYKEEAYRMKKKKVWNSYGIGSGIFLALCVAGFIASLF